MVDGESERETSEFKKRDKEEKRYIYIYFENRDIYFKYNIFHLS